MLNHLTVEAVLLVSPYKPVILLVVLALWARAAGLIDQDLAKHFFHRNIWNSIQMATAIVAFGLWLLIPIFWVGLPLAVLLLGGELLGYAFYRNPRVPPAERWTLSLGVLTQSFAKKIGEMQENQAQKQLNVKVLDPQGKPAPVPEAGTPSATARAALEQLLEYSFERHAQRIEFLAEQQKTSASVFIDGLRYPQQDIDPKVGIVLLDFIKAHAGLDINDRRKRQAGTLRVNATTFGEKSVPVVTSGSTRGINLVMTLDPGPGEVIALDNLGLLEMQKQQLLKGLDQPHRIVIVSAPPQDGQTTTLYSLLSRHDPYTQSVVTLEEEVPFEVEGVNHGRIDPTGDAASFNQKLRAMILRDPQVMLVGKIVDAATVKLLVDAAGNIRFYFGLRQRDTQEALKGWVKAVGNPEAAAGAVAVIVAERMMHKLCPTCRQAYTPDADQLRKLNLAAANVKQLYKHTGQVRVKEKMEQCPDCMGLGYRGRIPIFEVMVLDDEARSLIAAGQYEQLTGHLRKQKTLRLDEAAWARAVEGTTTVSEIIRVFKKGDEGPAPAAKAKK